MKEIDDKSSHEIRNETPFVWQRVKDTEFVQNTRDRALSLHLNALPNGVSWTFADRWKWLEYLEFILDQTMETIPEPELERLSNEALEEHRAGLTTPIEQVSP